MGNDISVEIYGSLGIRGMRPNVGAGLTPAQPRATTRAPTTSVNHLKS